MYYLNQAVHLAGPDLTPQTFKTGAFAMPGRGGAFDDQVTTQGNKVGDLGLGYPVRCSARRTSRWCGGIPARGLSNILGNAMDQGNYRYLDGGRRYTLQDWKKGKPKFFVDLETSVTHYDVLPDNDVPPEYPCDGCPSTGGAQVPANVRSQARSRAQELEREQPERLVGHVHAGESGVGHRVHDREHCADRAALAHALVPAGVRP